MQLDSQPAVDTVTKLTQSNECPLCGREPKKWLKLNHVYVCKRCRTKFLSRRQFAFLIDILLYNFLVYPLVVYAGTALLARNLGSVAPGFPWVFVTLPIAWAILLCKDGFGGMSPGKKICGVQVVDIETREPTGFLCSFKRNLPLLIPLVGLLVIAFRMANGRRWGDGWARTVVIWQVRQEAAL